MQIQKVGIEDEKGAQISIAALRDCNIRMTPVSDHVVNTYKCFFLFLLCH